MRNTIPLRLLDDRIRMSHILIRLQDLAEAERSTRDKSNAKTIEGKSTIHLLQLRNKSCWLICLNSRLVGVFERRCAVIAEPSLPFSKGSERFISRLLVFQRFISRLLVFLPGLRVFGSPARKSGFIHPHTLLPQTLGFPIPLLRYFRMIGWFVDSATSMQLAP